MIRRLTGAAALGVMLVGCGEDPTDTGDLTPVASVTITPIPGPLLTRQQLQLQARTFDRDGNALSDRPVAWESADPSIAPVTAGGTLTAAAPGTARIRATSEDAADSITVTVRILQLAHVFVGESVSCGLEADGNAWCWGKVGSTGYGNGSLDETVQDVPTQAAKGYAFSALAMGRGSTCGLELGGGVVCWGQNASGQLGDGSTTARGTPAPVAGLANVAQIGGGAAHYCARTGAGAVSCWGSNDVAQVGEAPRGSVTGPHPVSLPGPASDLVVGDVHSCALVAGQSFCWGEDGGGLRLGHDTTYNRLVPVLAGTGDGSNRTWTEVEANNGHTCARDAGGATYCWGYLDGLNDNDTIVWLPSRRFEGITATDLAGGWFVQCAVGAQQASCDGRAYPRVTLTAPAPISSVVVAAIQACVLQVDGAVACELDNAPRGTLTGVPLPAPATQIVASDGDVCALDTSNAVHCWATETELVPQAAFQGLTVTGVYANSGFRICVTAQGGVVSCRNSVDGAESTEPTGGLGLVTLAVGDTHTCGLTAAGAAWCWGQNPHGELGDGTSTDRATPVAVQGGHIFARISAGITHTCGLTTAGSLYCWGNGSYGSMGDNRRDESAAPVSVDGAPGLTRLGVSLVSTCGLDAAGAAWCWPATAEIGTAQPISGATGLVTPGSPCGIAAAGALLCWGNNFPSWFGDGTSTSSVTAVSGGNGLAFREVSFGLSGAACGIGVDGVTYCWGSPFFGSLGSPDATGDGSALPLKLYGSP